MTIVINDPFHWPPVILSRMYPSGLDLDCLTIRQYHNICHRRIQGSPLTATAGLPGGSRQ